MRLVTAKEAADYLCVTESRIYVLMRVEGFPAYRITERVLRVDLDEVDEWLYTRRMNDG